MKFIFECSTRYLTRSLRSLVRYRVEHSKINFISPRSHVLFSISKPLLNVMIPQQRYYRVKNTLHFALSAIDEKTRSVTSTF